MFLFSKKSSGYEILSTGDKWLIVGVVLGALLLIGFVTGIIFVFIFKKRIKNDSNAVNLLLAQRYEVIKDFISLAEIHGKELSNDDVKNIELLERISDFQALKKDDRDFRVLTFMHSAHNIVSVCRHSKRVSSDPVYAEKISEFIDIEESYRQKSAQYNADIVGYNYWAGFFIYKPIYRLFRIRNKDLIV